jgi:hypothetical protein
MRDAADFNDHLSLLNVKNHLVTFLHNRFNIFFVDGGAVFYHRSHIELYQHRQDGCAQMLQSRNSPVVQI